MNYNMPQPSVRTILFQSIAVVLFGGCLYLFCDAVQTGRQYDLALKQLQERKNELKYTNKQVDEYIDFIAANPFFRNKTGEPQWEKFAETWDVLPFPLLLQRFSELYREDQPFVLDYLAVSAESSGQTAEGEQGENREGPQLTIQGYYLCPCR